MHPPVTNNGYTSSLSQPRPTGCHSYALPAVTATPQSGNIGPSQSNLPNENRPTYRTKIIQLAERKPSNLPNASAIYLEIREFIDTIASYLSALKKIFVVEDMPAWNPNLRSKTAIRTSDTRLFETLAVRDLRIYADALDGQVYHYRDKTGLECDAVIRLRNGSYGLVEIKLGGDTLTDAGATSLLKLAAKIDTDKMKAPSFLMVLTGTGQFAYMRPDGVYVVPIACLKD